MPFSLDAEVAAVFAAAAEAGGPVPVTPRGDAIAMRVGIPREVAGVTRCELMISTTG